MATIVTRAGKGLPLTNAEVDANFTNLNGDISTLSGDVSTLSGTVSTLSGDVSTLSGTVSGLGTMSTQDADAVAITGGTATLTGPVKVEGTGVTSITPFAQSMQAWEADENNFNIVYVRNLNNGSDASADFVAYNDVSDVDSYFVDLGMNSSNFSSISYPIFTPNSAYLFTGGGATGQQSDLFIGTSNPDSDIVFFTGGVDTANQRAMFHGATGNLLLGTATDTGETLQVDGDTKVTGAAAFGSTVLLHANPNSALEAATKQYVDNATSTGIHIHLPVQAETSAALSAAYTQGGTTFNITTITGNDTITTSTTHGLSVNDQIWLTTSAGNGLSINTAYYVYSTPAGDQLKLSASYGGVLLTGLTNATGLSYATRANSGVGAYLESSANATLPVSGVTTGDRVLVYSQSTSYWDGVYTVTSLGSGSSKWKLTRATDANKYSPQDTNGMGEGDYFLVQSNSESYVLTTDGDIIIGYTGIVYTLFSSASSYTGSTNIDVSGGVISLTGTVPATNGGTGTSTVATGDLLYGSATNTWSKLSLGAAYKSITVNAAGTQIEWNAVALNQASAVSGQLGIDNGGTGQSTAQAAMNTFAGAVTSGSYLRGNGTNVVMATIQAADVPTLNQNTTGTAANVTATTNSTLTTLSALSLPGSQVSGDISGNAANVTATTNSTLTTLSALSLPGSQVTGNISGNAANISALTNSTLTTLSSLSLPGSQVSGNISGNAGNVSGTVAVGNGGTGQTTAQAAMNTFAGAVTSGSYLRGNGTNVVMSTIQAADVPTLNQNTTGTAANVTATTNSTLTTLSALSLPGSQVSGDISGNAANVTATTNSTLTTLSALSLPGSQVSGNISGNAATATTATTATNLSGGSVSGTTGTFSGLLTPTGGISNSAMFAKTGTAGEGGELRLEKGATSTLSADLVFDLLDQSIRFFENGGTNRGAKLDISAQSAGVDSTILTSSTSSASFPTLNQNTTGSAGSVASGGSIASNVTATTQAVKTSNTTVATTAFVDALRSLLASSTTGTAVVGDRGCLLSLSAGLTIPANVFAANDTFTIYNNTAGNLTITQGASLTLRQVGTANTGNRTLAQRGLVTVVFISATEAVITGGGLT